MKPERIAELRKRYDGRIYGGQTAADVRDMLDALESAQAEIAQLSEARRVVPEFKLDALPMPKSINRITDYALYVQGAKDGFANCISRLQSIPAARVLKDGEVGVSVEDADLFVQWYHALKDMNPLFLDPPDVAAYDRIKLVRTAQAKGATP